MFEGKQFNSRTSHLVLALFLVDSCGLSAHIIRGTVWKLLSKR